MKSILVLLCGLAILLVVSGKPSKKTLPILGEKPPSHKDKASEEEASGDVERNEEDGDSGKDSDEGALLGPKTDTERMQQQLAEEDPSLFEGDIVLTKKQEKELRKKKSGKKGAITGTQVNHRGNLVDTWPNGIVPYEISAEVADFQRERVARAIREYNAQTCVQFVPKTDDDRYWVRFVDNNRCSSSVGYVSEAPQEISIGPRCSFGTILHEMMHCIGFFHEHSRRDRDENIQILYRNIRDPKRYKHNFDMHAVGAGRTLGEPYDLGSIMHYGNNAFAIELSNGTRLTTIRAIHDKGRVLGQRVGFSETDVRQINLLYNCREFLDDPERKAKLDN